MVQEIKKALKIRAPNVPIAVQLSKFLFAYRSTPHSTTKESPASLVFKKAPITRFSFLHPCFGKFQRSNEEEVQPVASRGFSSGDTVWIVNQSRPPISKWIPGVIDHRVGPLMYIANVSGSLRHVHIEHIRHRHSLVADVSEPRPVESSLSTPVPAAPIGPTAPVAASSTSAAPTLVEGSPRASLSSGNVPSTPVVPVPDVTPSSLTPLHVSVSPTMSASVSASRPGRVIVKPRRLIAEM